MRESMKRNEDRKGREKHKEKSGQEHKGDNRNKHKGKENKNRERNRKRVEIDRDTEREKLMLIRRVHIVLQCKKITVLGCHRCLFDTGVEKMNYI
jgi:hypothetical protein